MTRKVQVAMYRGDYSEQVLERFWKRVPRRRRPDECWLWKGAIESRTGYGLFWDGRRSVRAHQVAGMLTARGMDLGSWVRHTCPSPACVNPRHLKLEEPTPSGEGRFWAYVDDPDETVEGCWQWEGPTNAAGTGVIRWGGRRRLAHEVACELTGAAIPEGMFVIRRCGNRRCVREGHLALSPIPEPPPPPRRLRGQDNPRAKVTDQVAQEIRVRFARGGVTQETLGKAYGLSRSAVCRIIKGERHGPLVTSG